MLITVEKIGSSFRTHWFFLAAIAVVSTDFFIGSLDDWSNARILETGVLLDLVIVVPALYFWCYRSRGKATILRAVALSGIGLWVAGYIVPNEHQLLLAKVQIFRYIGLTVLFVIGLKLMATIYRAAFQHNSEATSAALETAKEKGMPEWVARVLAWEASLWRKVWDVLQCKNSRD